MGSEDPWPPRSTRFRLLGPIIQILAGLVVVWAGVRTIALGSDAMGVFLFAVGGITSALAARQFADDGGRGSVQL